jgi:hypothetical protein
MNMHKPYVYPGCMHIHTRFSDGSGTVPEVIEAGQEAGLHWIIITDHNAQDAEQFMGWHDDLLVLAGHEITPFHSHYLALGVDSVVNDEQPVQDFVDEVYARGGFGIIAHPDDHLEDRHRGLHPWKDWEIDGPRQRDQHTGGLELWNFMSDWRVRQSSQRQKALEEPVSLMRGPTPAVLAWWDRLNMAGRRTFGILGLDAHATKEYMYGQRVTLFPYAWMFGTLTNYLLLDEPLAVDDAVWARHQLYDALRLGRSYGVNRFLGDAPELPLSASRGDDTWHLGDSPTLAGGPLTLHIDAGEGNEARLIHNGELAATFTQPATQTIEQPGVYRLEARRNGQSWLYTNPIFVQG